MRKFEYVITDEAGIHARPAGQLVKEAKSYASKITLSCKGKSAEATKLLAVMSMGVKKNDTVVVEVDGEDEAQAAQQMEEFFAANF